MRSMITIQDDVKNLQSAPMAMGKASSCSGGKAWPTHNGHPSWSPSGQDRSANAYATVGLHKLMELKSARLAQPSIPIAEGGLNILPNGSEAYLMAPPGYANTRQTSARERVGNCRLITEEQKTRVDYFRVLNNQDKNQNHREGLQLEEKWNKIKIVKKGRGDSRRVQPGENKNVDFRGGANAKQIRQSDDQSVRGRDLDGFGVQMAPTTAVGGGIVYIPDATYRQRRVGQFHTWQTSRRPSTLGSEPVSPRCLLDAQPKQIFGGQSAARTKGNQQTNGRAPKSSKANRLSRHHIAGDLRNFVHPSQQTLVAMNSKTTNMKYYLNSHRAKNSQKENRLVQNSPSQESKRMRKTGRATTARESNQLSPRVWQINQTLKVGQQSLSLHKQCLGSARLAIQRSGKSNRGDRRSARPKKTDIDVFMGLKMVHKAEGTSNRKSLKNASVNTKKSERAQALQNSGNGIREESPGQYLVNPRLPNKEQLTTPSRNSQKASFTQSLKGQETIKEIFESEQKNLAGKIPVLKNLSNIDAKTDGAAIPQLTDSRSRAEEKPPGTATLAPIKDSSREVREFKNQRHQVINKQSTMNTKSSIFKMIIQSEQSKQDNISEDLNNSAHSPASPIEKFIVNGDCVDEVDNSRDNQEILNDIMGLQRFHATLNQDQLRLRKAAGLSQETNQKANEKVAEVSPIQLKGLGQRNAQWEQDLQDQRWEQPSVLPQQQQLLSIQCAENGTGRRPSAKAATVATVRRSFKREDPQKCYKIPSISKCLQFKILPKNTKILQNICVQLAKHPMFADEDQVGKKRRRPKTGDNTHRPSALTRAGSYRTQDHGQNPNAKSTETFQSRAAKCKLRNDLDLARHRKKLMKESADRELKFQIIHREKVADPAQNPQRLGDRQQQTGASQNNCKKVITPNQGNFSQIPIQNHQFDVGRKRQHQILVSKEQVNQYHQAANNLNDITELTASPPSSIRPMKMPSKLGQTSPMAVTNQSACQNKASLARKWSNTQLGQEMAAPSGHRTELGQLRQNRKVIKFGIQANQIDERQAQCDALKMVLIQSVRNQSPISNTSGPGADEDDQVASASKERQASPARVVGGEVNKQAADNGLLAGGGNLHHEETSAQKEKESPWRADSRGRQQKSAALTPATAKAFKNTNDWQKDLPASIKHNLDSNFVPGTGINRNTKNQRGRPMAYTRIQQDGRSTKNSRPPKAVLSKNPDHVAARPSYQELAPQEAPSESPARDLEEIVNPKHVVKMNLDLNRQSEDSLEHTQNLITVKEHESGHGLSSKALHTRTLCSWRSQLSKDHPQRAAKGVRNRANDDKRRLKITTRSYRALPPVENHEPEGNRSSADNNIGSQEFDMHGPTQRRSAMKTSGPGHLRLALQKEEVDANGGSSALEQSSQRRRGTWHLQPASDDREQERQIPTVQHGKEPAQDSVVEVMCAIEDKRLGETGPLNNNADSPEAYQSFYPEMRKVGAGFLSKGSYAGGLVALGNAFWGDERPQYGDSGRHGFKPERPSTGSGPLAGPADRGLDEQALFKAAEAANQAQDQVVLGQDEQRQPHLREEAMDEVQQPEGLQRRQAGGVERGRRSPQAQQQKQAKDQLAGVSGGGGRLDIAEREGFNGPAFNTAAGNPKRGNSWRYRTQRGGAEPAGALSPPNSLPQRFSLVSNRPGRQLSVDGGAHQESEPSHARSLTRFNSIDDLRLAGEHKPIQRAAQTRRGNKNPALVGGRGATREQKPLQVVLPRQSLDVQHDLAQEERDFLLQGINQQEPRQEVGRHKPTQMPSCPPSSSTGPAGVPDSGNDSPLRDQDVNDESHLELEDYPMVAGHLNRHEASLAAGQPGEPNDRQEQPYAQIQRFVAQKGNVPGPQRSGRNHPSRRMAEYQIVTDNDGLGGSGREPTSGRGSQRRSSKTRTTDRELKDQITKMCGSPYILSLPVDERGNITAPQTLDWSQPDDHVDPSKENRKFQNLRIHGRTMVNGGPNVNRRGGQDRLREPAHAVPLGPSKVTIGEQVSLHSSSQNFSFVGQRPAGSLVVKPHLQGSSPNKPINNRIYTVFRKSKDAAPVPKNPDLNTQKVQLRTTVLQTVTAASLRPSTRRSTNPKSETKKVDPRPQSSALKPPSKAACHERNRDLEHLELQFGEQPQ